MKLHFQKLPNCTVTLSKLQKFSWGGAHRAPSPNPSPRFHSALRASIPRFTRTRRFAPRCALRASSALCASVRTLFARPIFAPLEKKSCLRHCLSHTRVNTEQPTFSDILQEVIRPLVDQSPSGIQPIHGYLSKFVAIECLFCHKPAVD